MSELLDKISECIEFGKINLAAPYPPTMKGMEGADELTKQALEAETSPDDILKAFIDGMDKVGKKFSENKVFVPQMLMSAKAMSTAMAHLKPFFSSGQIKHKGTVIIGTVAGDLHDIGKNIVSMMIEGGGWKVVDLGVDVKTDQFIEKITENPGCIVGLSALLTTTMESMKTTVQAIKAQFPETKVLIGGAPLNNEFCTTIGADFYSASPQGAVDYLNKEVA